MIEASLDRPAIFGELFRRHAPSIHRYAARRAGTAAADDVTSETFLVAFERRSRYDRSLPDARPWLYGIATNLLHRQRTAEARTFRMLEKLPVDAEHHSPQDDRDEALDAARALRGMARSIRRLSTGDRDCLLLYAWADLSYEQIATALDVPIGTVRSRINRARRTLRAHADLIEEGTHGRAHIASDPA